VICQHEVSNWKRIAASKPIAMIITVASELSSAGLQINFSGIRAYSQVLPAQVYAFACS